jgi:hypothetical protein
VGLELITYLTHILTTWLELDRKDPSPNSSSRARHPVSQPPPEDNVPGEAPEQGILIEIIDFSKESLFP